jgi:hypothetical protein
VKRLYESTLGRLELEVDGDVVSAWLFDADGRVVREGGDEWPWADLLDLLRTEIGLPEADAESITASFVEAAKAEGYEQETESSPLGNAVLWTLLVGIIVTLGIGVWTIVTRITVEVVVVALLLAAFWLVPAILILRWRDRRRDRPVA